MSIMVCSTSFIYTPILIVIDPPGPGATSAPADDTDAPSSDEAINQEAVRDAKVGQFLVYKTTADDPDTHKFWVGRVVHPTTSDAMVHNVEWFVSGRETGCRELGRYSLYQCKGQRVFEIPFTSFTHTFAELVTNGRSMKPNEIPDDLQNDLRKYYNLKK